MVTIHRYTRFFLSLDTERHLGTPKDSAINSVYLEYLKKLV